MEIDDINDDDYPLENEPRHTGQPYKPTDVTRGIVESAVAFGITYDDIARHLGITKATLIKYYRKELHEGVFKAHAKVGGVIFDLATKSADENVRLKAAMYYASRRMGWHEPHAKDQDRSPSELVITVNGGLPLRHVDTMTNTLAPPVQRIEKK